MFCTKQIDNKTRFRLGFIYIFSSIIIDLSIVSETFHYSDEKVFLLDNKNNTPKKERKIIYIQKRYLVAF